MNANSRYNYINRFRRHTEILYQTTGIAVAIFIAVYVELLNYTFGNEYSREFLLVGLSAIFISFLFSIFGAIVSSWEPLNKHELKQGKERDAFTYLTIAFVYIPIVNLMIALGNIALMFLLEAKFASWTGYYILVIIILSSIVCFTISILYIKTLNPRTKNRRNTYTLICTVFTASTLFLISFNCFKNINPNISSYICLIILISIIGFIISGFFYWYYTFFKIKNKTIKDFKQFLKKELFF